MITRIIGHTLLRIFDFYAAAPRRFVDRCGLLFLVALLFGIVSGGLITWLAWSLGLIHELYADDFNMVIWLGMFGEGQYTFAAFTSLALGLFAVRVWRDGEGALGERSFSQVWRSITHLNWAVFGVCGLVLLALNLILFNPLFDLSGLRDEMWIDYDDSVGPRKYRFLKYLNEVVDEALSWMPAVLGVFMLHKEATRPVKREEVREALRLWIAIAVLNFLIVSLEWAVLDYAKRFLLPLFSIPFEASLIPVAINGVIIMLLGGLLLPAHLLCVTVPFEQWAGNGQQPEPDAFERSRLQVEPDNPNDSST